MTDRTCRVNMGAHLYYHAGFDDGGEDDEDDDDEANSCDCHPDHDDRGGAGVCYDDSTREGDHDECCRR